MTDNIREEKESSLQSYGDPDDKVPLLDEPDEEKVAQQIYHRWKNYPKDKLQRERAEFKVNQWRLDGRTNVFVQKTQDQNRWVAWAPPFSQPPIPVLNKAKRLCRRLTSMTFADPPIVESGQEDSQPDDMEATTFSLRVLNHLQGEGRLDDLRNARRAFYRACVGKRGYIRYYADPKGGGRKPVRIMARTDAQRADAAFEGKGEVVARYARADGTLTDEVREAATQWQAGLKAEPLHALNVRLFPHDAEDIWDSCELLIGTMPTWGELLDLWPEKLGELTKEQKDLVFAFKPEHVKDLMGFDAPKETQDKRDEREKRVPVFMLYCRASSQYPDGFYGVVLADKILLHRQTWVGEVEGKREELDIPVTEYLQFEGGEGLMDLLGGGNEIRSAQVGSLLQYMDQFLNRKTYVPTNSILQGKSNQLLLGTQIAVNPGGEPKHEDIPPFPAQPLEMFTLMTQEMNDESGLQETAQGTEATNVNSGAQAGIIVAQAQAGLTDVKQNTERAWLRGCRIVLQLARITYSVPQQIDWTGEDGKYQQRWWTGADLKSGIDIRLKRGSLSMMTPAQKINLAMQLKQFGAYDTAPDLFYDVLAGSIGPTVGLTEDAQKQRIKRQLAAWSEGPPDDWQAPQAQIDPITGMPAVDPMTGQPLPPPPDPALMRIFDFLPSDELPMVAPIRLAELTRFMASTRYSRHPIEWRLGVDLEFEHMKQASGVMTVMEQQQMMAEQQAQMAAQQRAQMQAEQDGKAKEGEQQEADRQSKEAETRMAQEAKDAERRDKLMMQDRQFAHEKELAASQKQPEKKQPGFKIVRDEGGKLAGIVPA